MAMDRRKHASGRRWWLISPTRHSSARNSLPAAPLQVSWTIGGHEAGALAALEEVAGLSLVD